MENEFPNTRGWWSSINHPSAVKTEPSPSTQLFSHSRPACVTPAALPRDHERARRASALRDFAGGGCIVCVEVRSHWAGRLPGRRGFQTDRPMRRGRGFFNERSSPVGRTALAGHGSRPSGQHGHPTGHRDVAEVVLSGPPILDREPNLTDN